MSCSSHKNLKESPYFIDNRPGIITYSDGNTRSFENIRVKSDSLLEINMNISSEEIPIRNVSSITVYTSNLSGLGAVLGFFAGVYGGQQIHKSSSSGSCGHPCVPISTEGLYGAALGTGLGYMIGKLLSKDVYVIEKNIEQELEKTL